MFELTGDYAIILPLMAAIVLATSVSHLLTTDTIYTLKLRRRGIDLDRDATASALMTTSVGQVMQPASTRALPVESTLADAAAQLSRADDGQLPVIGSDGAYRGVVTARAVTDTLAAPGHETDTLASVVEYPPTVTVTDPLQHTLDALATADGPVPVLDPDRTHLVGWLTHQQVLRALQPAADRALAYPLPAAFAGPPHG
jgi:CIC family chloride channel protein